MIWRGDDGAAATTGFIADPNDRRAMMPLYTAPMPDAPADARDLHAPHTRVPRADALVDWRVWRRADEVVAAPWSGGPAARVVLPGVVRAFVHPTWMDAARSLHAAVLLDGPPRLAWVSIDATDDGGNGRVVAEVTLPAWPEASGCWLDARDGASLHVVLGVRDDSGTTFLCWSGVAGSAPAWAWSWRVSSVIPVPGATVVIAPDGARAVAMTALVCGAAAEVDGARRWPLYTARLAGDGEVTVHASATLDAAPVCGAMTASRDEVIALLRDDRGGHTVVAGGDGRALDAGVRGVEPPQVVVVDGEVYVLTCEGGRAPELVWVARAVTASENAEEAER